VKFPDAGRAIEQVLASVDRKIDLPKHPRISREAIYQRVNDMIQASPQLMNGIAKRESALTI